MTKSLLAIFGATGNQGNSTARVVLSDPSLSARYTVRAISRNISHPKMLDLKSKGAELVRADLDDPSSLPAALTGVSYLFFLTTTSYTGGSRAIETRQAKDICSAALAAGVEYIIFSSMSHPYKISSGKLTHVEHFDDKAEIEEYIRGLPIKSAFFAPGSFMQNFETHWRPRKSPSGDGSYVVYNLLHPNSKVPLIDITDTGKWIAAILSDPDKYEGKFFAAAERMYTWPEACEILSRVTGKTVRYEQVDDETFRGFMLESVRDAMYEMWVLIRDYGYFGEGQEEDVRWAEEQVSGDVRLTGLEEWAGREKYSLE